MTANKLTNLALALTATEDGVVSANATPAVDDSSLKLATTASLFQQMTAAGKQLLANPGYQKLPGGLIIQWGEIAVTAPYSGLFTQLVTLPVAFPNAALACVANFGGLSPPQVTNSIAGDAYSATQISIAIYANQAAQIYAVNYIAIGY